uniref:Uncharacterized protein n=1 Tax=Arundo donax TaxID=35708 RepID=A0A0A9HFG9_ARUDO
MKYGTHNVLAFTEDGSDNRTSGTIEVETD